MQVFRVVATLGVCALAAHGAESDTKSGSPLTADAWLRARTAGAIAAWEQDFERAIKTGAWTLRAERSRATLLDSIGGLPAERPDLNARVTRVRGMAGYRIESLLYDSQPGFAVSANLYLPANASSSHPAPGILFPCGHAQAAKAFDEYQSAAALLALNGFAVLVYDPIDQGERVQRLDDDGDHISEGVTAHMHEGMASLLLGWNLVRTRVWDGIRGVDYLVSRPEIDPDRLAVTGHSGGGTLTCFLFALDPRLKAAAPCCWGGQDRTIWDAGGDVVDCEQYLFGQLAHGFIYPDFLLTRPGAPVILLTATRDIFPIVPNWARFRELKRAYTAQGCSERVEIVEDDVPHSYSQKHREAMVGWMLRWLSGEDRTVSEPAIEILPEEDLFATPGGQVTRQPGVRTIWDLFRDESARLAAARGDPRGDELRRRIRVVTGINDKIAPLNVTRSLPVKAGVPGYNRRELTLLPSSRPVPVQLTIFTPENASDDRPVLVASVETADVLLEADSPQLAPLIAAGRTIAICRPFGSKVAVGYGGIGLNAWLALYELGDSLVRCRAEDLLLAARQLAGTGKVELIAEGVTAVPALHAAVIAPDIFGEVTVRHAPESLAGFFDLERSFEMEGNFINGVLRQYDIPDLAAELGDRLHREQPVDMLNLRKGARNESSDTSLDDPSEPGLVGVLYGGGDFRNPRGLHVMRETEGTWSKRGSNWSAEWQGFLIAPVDEPVTFDGTTNRSIELRIGDEVVLRCSPDAPNATGTNSFRAGEFVPIRIRFIQETGKEGSMTLRWSWPGHPAEPIPEANLRHSPRQWNVAQAAMRR